MTKESDFLLGTAFSLMTQIRAYLIRIEDVVGVELLEDEYQQLKSAINIYFYGDDKEIKYGK